MFVLGIDPGLSRCGYGVIELKKRQERAVAAGVIRTSPENQLPNRLFEFRNELRKLLKEYKPEVIAVERVLFQQNALTAISVGQVIGIVMVEGLDAGCEVIEYSPNEVKLAVAGHGGADKIEMEQMVRTLLQIKTPLEPVDAADALALAICYSANRSVGAL
ncbi:MAG: crossover junction endodeoxyribonuclease RuvC [Acidimicrobiales bacterium]|jgi:crossover junction endodeoxyribonuclease RuvC|nr:crossover junction endodeoxyribonuclease RuvC [Acidimicrobiales bacterium]MDP6298041.1 crossover junction endodeoxyribonuclease RuvC [Acidimicrobiales bacterium]HJM28906.1 crossover junction endodeoxyribonuclease RuvC [Acidimicrobiales bacterium]HJM97833.1 crossover junction endodeoxyribonuclease RuvC [Acidimicrobiales bacterium]|tara:strand:+ start:63 stop:545 length:483 start_codon:yes stop_codon:yes gene_type:complete